MPTLPKKMKILIACEFSQVVCRVFRDRGHDAYSCDLLPTEGNPDWHIQDDVLKHLNEGWDLMIAHPPLMATYIHTGRIPRIHHEPPGENQAKNRSRTYYGIAEAMAKQWG